MTARENWRGIDVHRPRYLSFHTARHLRLQAASFSMTAARAARALHQQDPFDIVIGYNSGVEGYAAVRVARELGKRSVCWAIGSDVNIWPGLSKGNAKFFRNLVRDSDMLLTESEGLAREVRRLVPGAANVHTYYKGIDVSDFAELRDRASLRGKIGLDPGRTYMAMLGSVINRKGPEKFAECFRQLASKYRRLDALWIGGGPGAGALAAAARSAGLAERLRITGLVTRPQALEYLAAADLMAFTSYSEGLPNAVMEAMAAGTPVASTSVDGIPEVIRDGVNGLLVPPRDTEVVFDGGDGWLCSPRDVEAMVAAVARLLDRPEEAARMATRARDYVMAHFDVDKNAAVGLDILRRVAAGAPAADPVAPCAGVEPGHLPSERL